MTDSNTDSKPAGSSTDEQANGVSTVVEIEVQGSEDKVVVSPGKKAKLEHWDAENMDFWEKYGNAIAMKNLLVSFPNLLLMFATWILWSILIVQIQIAHDTDPTVFAFTDWIDYTDFANPTAEELATYKATMFMLPSIAGLAGATLRVPNSFMVAVCGGQMHNAMNSVLAIIPMLGIALVLSDKDCTFLSLIIFATLSGVGGGGFASSMSSISFFFPKRKQGFALGVNAGLGNLGVSVTQLVIPLLCGYAAFGVSAPSPTVDSWPHNSGYFYVICLVIFSALAAKFMNYMPNHGSRTGSAARNFFKYMHLELIGYFGAFVAAGLFVASNSIVGGDPALVIVRIFILACFACLLTLVAMRFGTDKELQAKLQKQAVIFKYKHTWVQTYLYIMTFGSFIGYSSAFPMLINNVFGYLPDGSPNPRAIPVASFAWMGAFVGSVARVAGGWLSDRVGSGAAVTHWGTVVEVIATVLVGYIIRAAKESGSPEDYFPQFLVCFLLLFASTGCGNGSTFRQMSALFPPDEAGPVLGWTSAVAAYGAAVFPAIFAAAGKGDFVDIAMYAFAAYYASCLMLNYYYYHRAGAERPC